MQDNIHETINRGAMTPFQVTAVIICVVLNMLDGFDVLAMAFTAPRISAEWHLSGKELGLLLSAGLFGMAGGSMFLAPNADRFGRRPIILLCLVTISVGMLASALAQEVTQLAALRAITGVGIGGMLASINVITSEFSSNRWRSTAIALQVTGYPVGATIGGTVAGVLLLHFGWRSVFVFGGLATAAMLPWVWLGLPESLDFLIAKHPVGALAKANALLTRMRRSTVSELPPPVAAIPGAVIQSSFRSLFAGPLGLQTMMIWSAFFLEMFAFYFVLSWTPKLLVAAGMSAQQGITGGVLLNVGGIIGGTAFGFFAKRIGLKPLLWACFVATAALLVCFGMFATSLDMAFIIALLIGIGIFAAMAGLYAFAPILYPAETRMTGMGWAIGIGRVGAVLSPMAAGALLDLGWPSAHLYYVFAIPLLAAVFCVAMLGSKGQVAPLAAGAAVGAH